MLNNKQIAEELQYIKKFCDEYEFDTEFVPDMMGSSEPMLMAFLPTSDESVWSGEDLPEDPHVAMLLITQIPSENEETQPIRTKYLKIYTRVMVDLSEASELSILKLINDANSELDMGRLYYSASEGDEMPMVKYIIELPEDIETEFAPEAVAEAIVYAGGIYDWMKEALQKLTK